MKRPLPQPPHIACFFLASSFFSLSTSYLPLPPYLFSFFSTDLKKGKCRGCGGGRLISRWYREGYTPPHNFSVWGGVGGLWGVWEGCGEVGQVWVKADAPTVGGVGLRGSPKGSRSARAPVAIRPLHAKTPPRPLGHRSRKSGEGGAGMASGWA